MDEKALNEYKYKCKEYLLSLGIDALRAYGRSIGVEKPTTKKKNELIEDIISVLTGERAPIEQSKRGAPLRNDYVDPEIIARMENLRVPYLGSGKADATEEFRKQYQEFIKNNKFVLRFESDNASEIEEFDERVTKPVYVGQLETLGGVPCLLPLNCIDNSKHVVVPIGLIHEHDLREGDVVSCYTKKGERTYIVEKILTVNELALGTFHRGKFEEKEVCCPHKAVDFYKAGSSDSITAKYLQWLLPVYKGQRGCVLSVPKAGKTGFLFDVARSAEKSDRDLTVFVLLNGQSPENVGQFRKAVESDRLMYTTYDEEPERQVFVAEFLLKRAKRYAESGRNVLLIVDSFNALARAYNDTEESAGGKMLAGGLESKTLQYLRKYFGAARCFEKGGSLTIVGSVSTTTGNPADEVIAAELCALANLEVRLSETLALQRAYPAIDLLHSHTQRGDFFADEPVSRLRGGVCREFLPAHGEIALREYLAKSESFEEFIAKIGVKI